MRKRTGASLFAVLFALLLLPAGGCAQNRAALREEGPSLEAHVPPAEVFGVSLQTKSPEAPRGLLPLAQGDEAVGRNPASPGTGWIVIIEVTFHPGSDQPEPSANAGNTTGAAPDVAADRK